ncbi:nitrite reductase [Arthrobacter sp. CAU 1506]|uniref:NrfD/PsrC family molybdoenzyme membrane anchor subunit n=1 Tax=Arthrobacter sp. CAU 1506 TaxID=2560052 RepID=UPI0010ABBB7E|nr:NrfD/PsrC family molybdoenzyme membrane anchor subunit [Arthrobacter sp. CAU 1506]TJY71367.1 nitrite reductase [Arthrobacter sp. CAU 1506]
MTVSDFDNYRPPEPPRRSKRGGKRRRAGAGQGPGETPMVPEAEFTSYYGRPVVKPPPWGDPISAYLFLGGVAGGSALLGLGGQLTGRPELCRNSRLAALASVGIGAAALVADLGRPERFLNMLRTIKPTSPMSLGSWILTAFSAGVGISAASEIDRMTGSRLPLGPLRKVLRTIEGPAGVEAALFATPLSAYTAVLLSDTANPTWNAAREDLPFVFVSSASLAAAGLAMITTPVQQAGPARVLAVLGVAGDLIATRAMEQRMDPVAAEPLREGAPGRMLAWSQWLAAAGGIGVMAGGRHRPVAAACGVALLTASALTRFGVLRAGIRSTEDPRYTIEPQKRRLAARRKAGIVDDSITTPG